MSPQVTMRHSELGFSLVEMIAALAIIATIAAVAAPPIQNFIDNYRLGMAERDVERELQFARLKSVATDQPMRVRFNCPATGSLRVVELIGTTSSPDSTDADSVTTRCDESAYPYRPTGADRSRLTRPNNDGAVRYMQPGVTVTASKTLEFWPDGTVHADAGTGNPWPSVGSTGVTITLARKGKTRNITVNGLGKIQMDR